MNELLTKEMETYFQISQFYINEAELLDDKRYKEWFQLFTKDIIYQIPVRTTRYKKDGEGISATMYHVDDDYHILDKRVRRLQTTSAWSEDPPSRTRHLITNIRYAQGTDENTYNTKTNFLLYRSRGDEAKFDVLSGERHDVLLIEDSGFKITKRVIIIDQTNLSVNNLGVFL